MVRYNVNPVLLYQQTSTQKCSSRLAVRIRHIPDWDFDWADTQLQMNRDLVTISDFLPSETDAAELKKLRMLV